MSGRAAPSFRGAKVSSSGRGTRVLALAVSVLVALIAAAPARAQEPFDFDTFGELISEARASYDEARAVGDANPERARELLLASSAAQGRALDMLRAALDAGTFTGPDRNEAADRLAELYTAVVAVLVETGSCDAASDRLTQALSEAASLPEDTRGDLESLRTAVDGCVEHDATAEGTAETLEPAPTETGEAETGEAETGEAEARPGAERGVGATPEPPERPQPFRTAAWVTGSIAVACLATATGFYLHSQSLQDDLDAEVALPRFDPERATGLWDDVEQSDDLMNVFLWSGVALAAGTAVLVTLAVLDDGHDEAMVVPAAARGGALVGVAWRF